MLGGRDFDDAIAELLLEQAKTTLDCEVDRTPVVMYKLHTAAEKIKRDLSATGAQETDYSIPYLADGEDLDGDVTKEDVEAICKQKGDLFEVFYHFVFETVSECASDVKIDSIQICGSSMRIPQLQARLLEAVQHARQTVERVGNTLNMEEACARGCALFAQKYAVEKVLVSSSEKVALEVNGRVVSMEVFGLAGVHGAAMKGVDGKGKKGARDQEGSVEKGEMRDAEAGSNEDAIKDVEGVAAGSKDATKDVEGVSAGSKDATKDIEAISAGSNEGPHKDIEAISAGSNEGPHKDIEAISTGSNEDASNASGLFVINGNQPLQNGNDHDCTNASKVTL